ncbi:MAG: hypothetical protein E6J90_41005 [Deltaproteobacteria bacterium]|nr:MAG: hypothetical protein E6J91_39380 [Deltaproteobacteria bacterium]TMQ08232.1 MAG: hypothetical protein E6J90_41005 [Deltaproteobacteria bacterium]
MKEIEVRDVSLTATYHIRYSGDAVTEPGEVGYGKRFVVYLQSGFEPRLRAAFADTFGVMLPEIDFINEQSDTVDYTFDNFGGKKARIKFHPTPDYKVKLAKTFVTQYLPSLGLDTALRGQLTALIDQQNVMFLNKTDWARAAKGPGGSAESTEGITTPDPRGKRRVLINNENHTLNAIVHELFHTIENDALTHIVTGVVEGVTEYFALQASGLDFRVAGDGGRVYRDNMRVLRLALAKGAVTHAQLVRGYFLGETAPLDRLIGGWNFYARENEGIAFTYTGVSPTPQQIAQLWQRVEAWFS